MFIINTNSTIELILKQINQFFIIYKYTLTVFLHCLNQFSLYRFIALLHYCPYQTLSWAYSCPSKNIQLRILFSNTISLDSSLNVRDHVSEYNLIFQIYTLLSHIRSIILINIISVDLVQLEVNDDNLEKCGCLRDCEDTKFQSVLLQNWRFVRDQYIYFSIVLKYKMKIIIIVHIFMLIHDSKRQIILWPSFSNRRWYIMNDEE